MPLFPSFNDLKGMTISINPLNLFEGNGNGNTKPDPGSPTASTFASATTTTPNTPRAGEAGPGPSSLSLSTRLNGSSPLAGHGAGPRPARPGVKSNSSESGVSTNGDRHGRPGSARRASCQVVIHADEPPRREKKKKVPMDVSLHAHGAG
jgi:hypothetical protein